MSDLKFKITKILDDVDVNVEKRLKISEELYNLFLEENITDSYDFEKEKECINNLIIQIEYDLSLLNSSSSIDTKMKVKKLIQQLFKNITKMTISHNIEMPLSVYNSNENNSYKNYKLFLNEKIKSIMDNQYLF